jgi:DNA-directed RNA polymerase subunit alpha (EC 2.7.7.6)
MCGKKLEYVNRIKITNTDFDYDDPEFLINLELSVRSYNCLRRAGIFSINDFCKLDKDSLMHVKNLGRRSYAEIAFALKEHGVIISDILKTAMTYYPYFDNNIFYKGGLKWDGKC